MTPLELTTLNVILELLLAVLIGGVIGLEREYRNKSAGLRTLILICIGAALFTNFSILIGRPDDMTRIASNVVVGIGFVGAGVIFRSEASGVNGLTTAALIWVTAALGVGLGAGYYVISLLGCVLVLMVLMFLTYLEQRIDERNQVRVYKISLQVAGFKSQALLERFKSFKLNAMIERYEKHQQTVVVSCTVQGRMEHHARFIAHALQDEGVLELEC
jgi:putative Mg2+ transporter-C (MgtC) family protein